MREIKFRGLTPDGIWVYGFLYQDETGAYIKDGAKNKRFGTGIDVERESIGQYTGLRDKNGKEIYEGDVFTSEWRRDRHVIQFSGGAFRGSPGTGVGFVFDTYESSTSTILGNIYENPELLK